MLSVHNPQSYEEFKATLTAEQQTMSREDILNLMSERSEAVFDPENLPVVRHNWIDRGLKLSCEGAGHPYHQSWKTHRR